MPVSQKPRKKYDTSTKGIAAEPVVKAPRKVGYGEVIRASFAAKNLANIIASKAAAQ